MKKYENIGVKIPKILLPNKSVDLTKWAVIACDQYTSEPEYWKHVDSYVNGKPSTLRLIYPEVFLKEKDKQERIIKIQNTMDEYVEDGVLEEKEGLIYVERKINGRIRQGLIVAVDLEKYDYSKGSKSLIRATEGTIVDRLPPRIAIREGALIELPHIMVLIDDPKLSVIEYIASNKERFEKVYDFELMMNGGHLTGYRVDDVHAQSALDALEKLSDKNEFKKKYSVEDEDVLLFAMGDGNHSLATAKAIWEKLKVKAGNHINSRYALVELINIYSPALEFEPIHRVVFGLKKNIEEEMKKYFKDSISFIELNNIEELEKEVKKSSSNLQIFGMISDGKISCIKIKNSKVNIAVGTLQLFLDEFMNKNYAEEIDYVHGTNSLLELSSKKNNAGFFLPTVSKDEFFRTVILDGALPRKTFSMGEADEKRFYMESRRIR